MEQRWRINGWCAALLLLLGVGAFWDGLYTPAAQLLLAAAAALLALPGWRAAEWSRLELVAMGLLVVGVAGSLRQPAAAGVAAHGPVLVAGWLLAMVAGRTLGDGQGATVSLARFWGVTGAFMAFGGLLAISFTPPHHSGRLAAFLGYPIAVGILGLLGLTGLLPDLAERRWWAAPLALGSGMALMLSGSRWVWLVALLLLGYLAWRAPGLLRRAGGVGLPSISAAMAASLWAAPAVAERTAPQLRLILFISLLTLGLLLWFQQSRLLRWGFWLGIVLSLALAPGWPWLMGRASAIPLTEGSSVERLTFLQDGLALLRDLPLGGGFRAWSALHLQAASYAYYSAEVHSAPLDLALAFGWAGGIGFLLLLGRFLWQIALCREGSPYRLVTLAGLGALSVHALLDWDLSYGLFAYPLWFGFGLLKPVARPVRLPPRVAVAVAALTLAACALLGAGDLFTAGARQALERGAPEIAMRHARAAIAVTPWSDHAHALLGSAQARLGMGEQALASFRAARRLGPHEPWYAQLLAQALVDLGRDREAATVYHEYVELWPWQTSAYEEALQADLDMLVRARALGDSDLAAEIARSGRALLDRLARQKAKEPEHAPRRPMAVDTPVIRQARRTFEGSQP